MIYFSNEHKTLASGHIGTKLTISPHTVSEVQADGNELERIRMYCKNLPMTGKRVVKFYGDDAKFIAGNWNSFSKIYQ